MKTVDKLIPILFLIVYMVCLLLVGLKMFQDAGKQTNQKISIYKESNTPIMYVENESESETASEMDTTIESEDEIDSSDDIADADTTEDEMPVLQLAADISVKTQESFEEKDEYNGSDIQDNGLPYAVKINRQENIVTIYELDSQGYYTVPVKVMCCSVSENGVTPTGSFTTSDKFEWAYLKGGVCGQYAYRIYRGILFHSVPYVTTSHSQLETWEYNKLGTGASLGCIRLCVADAKWIYENCPVGTQVNIFDSDYYGPLGKPQPAYVLEDTENPGWDPTDMTEGNPYMTKGQIFGVRSHTIQMGEPFDEMSGVMAFSSDMEDVTSMLTVEGEVDNRIAGDYELTYKFYDKGQAVSASIVITVEDREAPVITMAPEEMTISGYTGNTGALTKLIGTYVTVYDGEILMMTVEDAAVVTDIFYNNAIYIDTSNVGVDAGTYPVYVFAIDGSGNISDKVTIMVHIVV